VRYRFIQNNAERFAVRAMCRVLKVKPAGYYAWLKRKPTLRDLRRLELIERIRCVHQQSRGTYGSPRVHRELVAQGTAVCENTVAKVMKQQQIRSKTRRRFVVTTDSDHGEAAAANLLDRQFNVPLPNQVWCADITFVPTRQGWLFLALVMDLCSCRIVGWSMADHLRSDLTCDALQMALRRRRPGRGLLHHSDRGIQYACGAYQDLLADHCITCSMSRRGDCYDNAAMESFIGTLKRELVHHEDYATHEQARQSIFEFIEGFYNRRRRHSAIGYQSPESFEASLN
jgi:transposase InsO family protein